MPGTRKLGRKTAHRNLMLRGMVTYLLENGKIETTYTRAKEVAALTEKMITIGKTNDLASRRKALSYITKEDVVSKLFTTIAPEYADRNGGYTRIYKLGPRRGDAAEMALIELIPNEEEKAEDKGKKKPAKKSAAKSTTKKTAPKATKSSKETKEKAPAAEETVEAAPEKAAEETAE
ncbi:MAG: 50S ribosomal protein L17 [Clostridiales bacterium]|nr:50S ribosomal protein L17 [Clostridiales bacterium]